MPERWRVGRKVGRTVYIGDQLVGLMDTPELATQVVQAVNRAPTIYPDELEIEYFDVPGQTVLVTGPCGVRIRHKATGLVAASGAVQSRLMNKVQAFEELRAALMAGIPADRLEESPMPAEPLPADEPWPVDLPPEPPRDRRLEAVDEIGEVVQRWRYSGWCYSGWCSGHPSFKCGRWHDIVRICMYRGWTLRSLPAARTDPTTKD